MVWAWGRRLVRGVGLGQVKAGSVLKKSEWDVSKGTEKEKKKRDVAVRVSVEADLVRCLRD